MAIDAPAAPRPLAAPEAPAKRRDLPGSLVPAVLVAELAALYLIFRGGGWVFDDNLSIELARADRFTWGWLTSNLFGHFEIAHRAIFSLQADLMPIDYRWALLAMLALIGIAGYLLSLCVRLCTQNGWAALVVAAYFGVSVLLISPLQWWSSGLESFPTLVCDLLCLWAYLHYLSTPRPRWIALSAGALALGLLFYEKPAYMPLYLIFIRVLVLNDDFRWRKVAAALWRERAMWIAYAAVIIGYVVLRETTGAGSIASGGSASLGAWVAFFRIMWAQALVPALFGLRVPGSNPSSTQVMAAIALQIVFIALVLISIRLRRDAWRVWLTVGLCAVATGVLVGAGRLADFGPPIAGDPRYLIDFLWLVPLMTCLAFFGPRRAESMGNQPARPARRGRGIALTALGVIVACAYVATSVVTAVHVQRQWQGPQGREWEQRMLASMAAVRRAHPHPIVANNDAPWFMVESAFSPYNELSYILPAYHQGVQVDGPLDGPLFAVDTAGRVQPAVMTPVHRVFTGSPGCTRQGASAPPLVDRFPALNPDDGPYYLRVAYRTSGELRVPVFVDRGTGYPYVPDVSAWLVTGAQDSLAWLGDMTPRAIRLTLPPKQQACVTKIDLVSVHPA
jgi:hypothetical protein